MAHSIHQTKVAIPLVPKNSRVITYFTETIQFYAKRSSYPQGGGYPVPWMATFTSL